MSLHVSQLYYKGESPMILPLSYYSCKQDSMSGYLAHGPRPELDSLNIRGMKHKLFRSDIICSCGLQILNIRPLPKLSLCVCPNNLEIFGKLLPFLDLLIVP